MPATEVASDNDFTRVVALNEATKELLRRSFEVNLLALDAMVQSKRGGGTLRGFDEVSAQMRMWTRDLHEKLERLATATGSVVSHMSEATKEAHLLRILEAAARESGDAQIRASQRALESRHAAITASARADWRKTRDVLDDLDQLGMMACVLARSAMIEATSAGPELREQLDHVSREFYLNSEAVVDILKAALKRTG